MVWVKVDDEFYVHPKVMRLETETSLACIGLHLFALCWSNQQLTDGFIPSGTVARLAVGDATMLVDDLLHVGLWEKTEGGYQIHDYLDFQPSRAQYEAEIEAKRAGGKKGMASRWGKPKPADNAASITPVITELYLTNNSPPNSPVTDPITRTRSRTRIEEKEEERGADAPPAKRAPREGDWVAKWVDAEREAGREPGPSHKATFGKKVRDIADLDPLIMADAIRRMAEQEKHPGVLPYVYGDCKRVAEREIFEMQTGRRQSRVR